MTATRYSHARDAAGKALADAEIAGHEHAAALCYLLDWLDPPVPGPAPGGGRAPHRARRPALCRTPAPERRDFAGTGYAHPTRPPAPAAWPGWCAQHADPAARGRADRLLRHRLPPQPARAAATFRAAGLVFPAGRAPLRLSRPVLPIHRPAIARPPGCRRRGPRGGRPFGQWRQRLCLARPAEHGQQHGFYRAGWADDGHPAADGSIRAYSSICKRRWACR